MISRDKKRTIARFWKWFREHEADFNQLASTDDPFWDVALRQLQQIDKGIWFVTSSPDPDDRDFIITAEGDTQLFSLVEFIVARAPSVTGWRFIALKPPLGFGVRFVYEGVALDPKAMWVQLLERKSNPEWFGIRVGVPGFDTENRRSIQSAVLEMLEMALGERVLAEEIQYVIVSSVPEKPTANGYFRLPGLTRYVGQRKRV